MTEETPATARLELAGITKRFPGVVANDDVSFKVAPGQIHALLGENGAGKSTLVKIIYGVLHADEGDVLWQGQRVQVADPHAARRLGIDALDQRLHPCRRGANLRRIGDQRIRRSNAERRCQRRLAVGRQPAEIHRRPVKAHRGEFVFRFNRSTANVAAHPFARLIKHAVQIQPAT